ncbi:MAG: hypothetical protein AAF975_02505 [Spirochaetota bacterium]
MAAMVKNVFVDGQMQTLLVPLVPHDDDPDDDDDLSIFEALQAQAQQIELLEEQNNALMRQERVLLQLLELSSQTGQVITESLLELKNLLNSEPDPESLQELAQRFAAGFSPENK